MGNPNKDKSALLGQLRQGGKQGGKERSALGRALGRGGSNFGVFRGYVIGFGTVIIGWSLIRKRNVGFGWEISSKANIKSR
jgi:hypothetical protein